MVSRPAVLQHSPLQPAQSPRVGQTVHSLVISAAEVVDEGGVLARAEETQGEVGAVVAHHRQQLQPHRIELACLTL